MMPIVLVGIGLLGLAVGSFLNVVIWRVPNDLSVVSPRSFCPTCERPIREYDNIPVVSWLVLRGRCRSCKARISLRYPLVEIATGVLFVVTTLEVAYRLKLPWAAPAYLYFTAIGIALTMIDFDVKRLPDRIVLPSYPILGALLIAAALLQHNPGRLLRVAIAAGVLFAAFYILWFVYPGGMGFGDVKLAGVLGLVLGFLSWPAVAVGAFLSFVLGGLIGAAAMVVGHAGRKTQLAFGPFLIMGSLVSIYDSDHLWHMYTTIAA